MCGGRGRGGGYKHEKEGYGTIKISGPRITFWSEWWSLGQNQLKTPAIDHHLMVPGKSGGSMEFFFKASVGTLMQCFISEDAQTLRNIITLTLSLKLWLFVYLTVNSVNRLYRFLFTQKNKISKFSWSRCCVTTIKRHLPTQACLMDL